MSFNFVRWEELLGNDAHLRLQSIQKAPCLGTDYRIAWERLVKFLALALGDGEAQKGGGRKFAIVSMKGDETIPFRMKGNPMETKPPLPPFTEETAKKKIQAAEDAWNTRDPERVALAYTPNSQWRNRSEFFSGREAIKAFLRRKWERELDYRLKKELWCFNENRIAVRFEYEWHDDSGQWYRSYGNENWEFAENGLMQSRFASINDLSIKESERKHRWERGQ